MVDIDRLQGEVLRLSGLLGLDRQRARLNRWSSLGKPQHTPLSSSGHDDIRRSN